MRTVAIEIGQCEFAIGFIARATGLLGRRSMAAGAKLVLAPCRAVHTVGMRFPIDALFFSESGQVLAVYENLRPGRLCVCWRAQGVIEAAAGWTRRECIVAGDHIDWRIGQDE